MALNINPSRKQAEIGFAAILLGVAVYVFAEAGSFPSQSAGYPRVLAVMLGICSTIVIIRTLLQSPQGQRLMDHPRRCLGAFVLIFFYILGIDWLGYILPSIVFSISIPVLLGYRQWKVILPVVFGMVVFILIVFKVLLERPLPPDILDFLF